MRQKTAHVLLIVSALCLIALIAFAKSDQIKQYEMWIGILLGLVWLGDMLFPILADRGKAPRRITQLAAMQQPPIPRHEKPRSKIISNTTKIPAWLLITYAVLFFGFYLSTIIWIISSSNGHLTGYDIYTCCFLGGAILFLGFLMYKWRNDFRLPQPKGKFCPTCGYDLRATPDRCPECGNIPPKE